MNETGTNKLSIPPRLQELTGLIPNNEEIIYWLIAHDDFLGYFTYINRETSQSCPPISYCFICCNIFNIPCIYSDFKNNSQKILMCTENSVALGQIEDPGPCCCCFSPSLNVEVYSWNNIKFIGSKQEFAKIQKERDPSGTSSWEHAFLTEPLDLFLIAKGEDTRQHALWLDYLTYRSLRVDEIKGLKAKIKAKKANQKSRLHHQHTLDSIEERPSESHNDLDHSDHQDGLELSTLILRPENDEEEEEKAAI